MMVKSYREDCNEAKAAREGIIEQRPVSGKSKRPKSIVVEYRMSADWAQKFPAWMGGHDWKKWKSYRAVAEAEKAMSDHMRKSGLYEFRLADEAQGH
jgi:hypothetical protein